MALDICKTLQVPIFPIEQEIELETKVSGVQRKKSQASYSLSVGSPLFEAEVRSGSGRKNYAFFSRVRLDLATSLHNTSG